MKKSLNQLSLVTLLMVTSTISVQSQDRELAHNASIKIDQSMPLDQAVAITNDNNREPEAIQPYFNPDNTVVVKVETSKAETVQIRILNRNNELVRKQFSDVGEGLNMVAVNNVGSLEKGIYYYEIITSSGTEKVRSIRF